MRAQSARRTMIRAAMAAPYLEREEEYELAVQWKEKQDQAALHKITSAHMRLVISMAAKFRHFGLPMNDLIQEGHVGLLEAAARFEPEREVRFSTYAAWWIRSAMQDYILRNWSIVRTGTTAAQKALFFNLRRLRAKIAETTGNALSPEGRAKIAAELNVPVGEVEDMEMRLAAADQSLNSTVGEEGDDEWQDFLADQRPDPEEVVIGMRDAASRSRWLAEALGQLTPRERTIISQRRLRDDAVTLEELGRELGVSKERVRQLENRALRKLRDSISRHVEQAHDLFVEA
jgi:RNA polymerase sigma-32 factor